MTESFELGRDLRELLRGLLDLGPHPASASIAWGRVVDASELEDLFAPQEVRPFTATPGGIDNLALSAVDSFMVRGVGEVEAEFKGYFRVARAAPTTNEWATCEVFVNIIDLQLRGESRQLGPLRVSLNPRVVSAGQTIAPGLARGNAKCRIATAAIFEAPEAGFTLANTEPILLMNGGINSIPPVEDPNGQAFIYNLPLYNVGDADAPPTAYLTSLRYTVGNYLTQDEVASFRAA
ncbi:MAG: DUF6073 family protein [Actinomycetota bacterium]|nr:DUF6073 family protein [Actinomycetota bacterium]